MFWKRSFINNLCCTERLKTTLCECSLGLFERHAVKMVNRKVLEEPQAEATAIPQHQEEEKK